MRMIAFITTAALALSAAPALAGPPTSGAWRVGASSYHLYLTDLDLHTPAGRAEALGRLEKVAARLCHGQGVQSRQQACIAATVAATKGSAAQAVHMAAEERGRTAVKLAERN